MARYCLKKFDLSLENGASVFADEVTAPDWHDYFVNGQIQLRRGTEGYLYLYRQDSANWYRAVFDYLNRQILLQESVAGVVTPLDAEDVDLVMNARHPFLAEIVIEQRTRVPSVFYDPGGIDGLGETLTFDDRWEVIAGSPGYSGGAVVITNSEEVRAIPDVYGPCLHEVDALAQMCDCDVTADAGSVFGMAGYALSFKVTPTGTSAVFQARMHFDHEGRRGTEIEFDVGANTVTLYPVTTGGVRGTGVSASATMNSGSTYTFWARSNAAGDIVELYWDVAGTPTKLGEVADALGEGHCGFGVADASPSTTIALTDILVVPIGSEAYEAPLLINMRDNAWLQDRDGVLGALDGAEITTGAEARNFIRITCRNTEIKGTSRAFQKGTLGVVAEATSHLYMPVLTAGPLLKGCRGAVAI